MNQDTLAAHLITLPDTVMSLPHDLGGEELFGLIVKTGLIVLAVVAVSIYLAVK